MILSKKVRLYPSEIQEQKLWQSVGTARFIYNWTLSRQEENYKNGGKFISDNELRKEITKLKKDELSWLNKVSNNVAKQAVKDGCDAYKRFFKGLADKPRFKSRRKSKNIYVCVFSCGLQGKIANKAKKIIKEFLKDDIVEES